MDRFECTECGDVVFSADDLEYRPCKKCDGEYVSVPFGFDSPGELPIEFVGSEAW